MWGAFEPGLPIHQRIYHRIMYPFTRKVMYGALKLDDAAHVARAKTLLQEVLDAADAALQKNAFLTGPAPCYIDIAFASLIGATIPDVLNSRQFANGRFSSLKLDPKRTPKGVQV
mmetsp:Transcript_52700/g.114413  ORF Transcript_52700/g.114413 Transcript_52700/m.114413 type:complete len:115 (+) Transcript_52700:642-986(+)